MRIFKKNKVRLLENRIQLKLSQAEYFVSYTHFDEQLTKKISEIKSNKNFSQHVLLTNSVLSKIYSNFIEKVFFNFQLIILPDGENQKQLKTLEYISNQMAQFSCDRKTLIWAFGGGVIGDLAGFVASVYMRGISYVQIPTTLLAMVDSSVGGKTAVNIPRGKNYIGTFFQPKEVLMHLPLLKSLPQRELLCGMAEIIKSALIYDEYLFSYIEKNSDLILQNNLDILGYLSYQSVAIKADVVSKDEKEQSLRAILNFGHTLAHAIESYFQYEKIKHGEAVSIGLSFASFFSYKKKLINYNEFDRVYSLLHRLKMMRNISDLPIKNLAKNKNFIPTILGYMQSDKKNYNKEINFIFIHKIGGYLLPQKVDQIEMEAALQEFFRI